MREKRQRKAAIRERFPGLLVLLVVTGCSSRESVVRVRNVERAVTAWSVASDPRGQTHMCLEYATPAETLQATKAALAVPIGEKSATVSYESAQSLATIYSVSEIMQFGHAALYRLCEASGNRSVTNDTYGALFRETLTNMNDLLRLQLLQFRNSIDVKVAELEEQIAEKDEQICAGLKGSTDGQTDADLRRERAELKIRFDRLSQQASRRTALPAEPLSADAAGAIVAAREQLKTAQKGNKQPDIKAACGKLQGLWGADKDNGCGLVNEADLNVCGVGQ